MKADQKSCSEIGIDHNWKRRGATRDRGALVYFCPTCTAWGWAPPHAPSRVTMYTKPFRSREPKVEAEITARPREAFQVDVTGGVDRRGERAPKKTKERKGERAQYSPRWDFADWQEAEWPSRRGERRELLAGR
jgi:hypothetical protein